MIKPKPYKDFADFSFMYKSILILILLLGTIFVAACDTSTLSCGQNYLLHEGKCCLDKNANNICDIDETSKVSTVVRERPYVFVEETCDASSRFVCVDKTITSNYIKLKLRLNKDELVTVHTISLPALNCQQTFDAKELAYGDEQEYTIPCVIDQEAIASELRIEGTTKTFLRYSNGQVYTTSAPTQVSFAGKISGAVR